MEYKNLNIKWLGNSGFLIKHNGMNIYIDPIKLANFDNKADIVLITHGHYDHCSIEDIRKIIKHGTKIIGPAEVLSQTRQIKNSIKAFEDGIDFEFAEAGKVLDFNGIKINCVHAYNINKPFHSKGDCVGYVIDFPEKSSNFSGSSNQGFADIGTIIYHAGDTDLISELQRIKADIALLPVSGKFTMTSDEAAKAAEIIKPDLAIPMHFGTIIGTKQDAERFVSLCNGKGIRALVMEKEI